MPHVKLNELENALEDLPYPLECEDARRELSEVTLVYADGEEPLPDVIDRIDEEVFDDPADLVVSVMNVLPTEAVGEPGQSEGEG